MSTSFLLLLAVAAVSGDDADPCEGRRIHIRRLPPRFNTDLLRHCGGGAFPLSEQSSVPPCESLANHGLGPRTHPRTRSWYRTDTRLLEAFFHRRVEERGCLADAVFVPYVLDPALFDASARHGAALAEFLARDRPRILARRRGHDHFLVVAGSAWDYAQPPAAEPRLWGSTSLLPLPELANFTFLTLESRTWPWQEHAIPHPTSFHPSSLPRLRAWLARARRAGPLRGRRVAPVPPKHPGIHPRRVRQPHRRLRRR
jgi:hypothetical protein